MTIADRAGPPDLEPDGIDAFWNTSDRHDAGLAVGVVARAARWY